MTRVRHYTRVSSMRKIIEEQRIVARDQNKVFVERASSRLLSPSDAEERYGLQRGKGNAYAEFDVADEELRSQYNRRSKDNELFLVGDVDLSGRAADGHVNH